MTSKPSVIKPGGKAQYHTFRVTQFVHSNPSPPTPSPSSNTANLLNPSSSGTVPPTPPSETLPDRPNTAAEVNPRPLSQHGALTAKSNASAHKSGPQNGFSVIELPNANGTRNGILGPHQDGRVRNPIPRVLKGKNDVTKGSFA